ncbi:hypothetical protein ES703_44274 [subsurface metagenome]
MKDYVEAIDKSKIEIHRGTDKFMGKILGKEDEWIERPVALLSYKMEDGNEFTTGAFCYGEIFSKKLNDKNHKEAEDELIKLINDYYSNQLSL